MIPVQDKPDEGLHRSLPERHIPTSTTLHYEVDADDSDAIFMSDGLDLSSAYSRSLGTATTYAGTIPVTRTAQYVGWHDPLGDMLGREPMCTTQG
eukprot:5541457-Amphidinium_carterae.1